MSISIGILQQRIDRNAHTYGPDRVNWSRDPGQLLARANFELNPEESFSGLCTMSVETGEDNPTSPLLNLATESPSRFLDLASHLTPVLQDILIQYYLLGRTFSQIGSILFPQSSADASRMYVTRGHAVASTAIAVVVQCRGSRARLARLTQRKRILAGNVDGRALKESLTRLSRRSQLEEAWQRMLQWEVGVKSKRNPIVDIRAHRDLGSFVIAPNGQLAELFAPSWSVLRRAGKGDGGC